MKDLRAGALPQRVLLAFVFLFLVLLSSRTLSDPDLGWHLRTGERIIEEKGIPKADDFTYTVPGNRWRINQPLAEVLLYGVYRALGGPGLILLTVAILVAMLLFVRSAGRLAPVRNRPLEAVLLLLAVLASSSHMLTRPNTISALLVAVTAWAAERARRGRPVRAWVFPALFAVWAEVHPGFLFGLALLACAVAGGRLARPDSARGAGLLRPLLLSGAAALLSGVLLNRSNLRALILPLGLGETGAFHFRALQEFQSASPARDPFFFLLLALVLVSFIPRGRRDAADLLSVVLFGALAFRAVRMIQPFAVVAAPIAIRNLSPLAERLLPNRSRRASLFAAGAAAGVLFLGIGWWSNDPLRIPTPREARALGADWAWAPVNYPVRAFRFLDGEDLPGEVFHPDRYGGPFVWYFYPRRKDFIDGRIEVFGEPFWVGVYGRILACGPGWEDLLAQRRVSTLLLETAAAERGEPLASGLPSRSDWGLVYFDDETMIYVRRSALDPGRWERLALRGVDPLTGPAPRSREDEVLAGAGVRRCLDAGRSLRALLFEMRLLSLRGEWARIAGTPDAAFPVRGRGALREELHLVRGEARLRTGDWKGALEDWGKARRVPAARSDRLLLTHLEEEELERRVPFPAVRAGELARLAGLLRDAGEHDRAAEFLREAVRREGRPEDRNALAWTLLETETGTEEALHEARLAAAALPSDGYTRGTLARALLQNGDRAGAERAWREAIGLLPPDDYRVGASLRARLALLLADAPERARTEEALSWGADALRLDYETEERFDLLRLLAKEGREEEIARIASREGELRDRANRIEGKPPIEDGGRGVYAELLRDLGFELGAIERLQRRYLPRIDPTLPAAGGARSGRKG